jgi:hypothetical protein
MTFNKLKAEANSAKLRKFALPVSFLVFVCFSLSTMNCADEPTSLGLKFLPSSETTGVRIFDSYIDTMRMSSYNIKYRVNTYVSNNLFIGIAGTYNSKALIKFTNLPSDKGNATVSSAVLKLKYRNYYFPTSTQDSLAQISFDIYRVLQNLNYPGITLDSVTSSAFGTVSKGSYTGAPAHDRQEISINLDTTMVKDWLKYAADTTNYPVKNYGIVLSPNASSAVLKSFYSGVTADTLKPAVTVIYRLNGITDTLVLNITQTLFLADAVLTPLPGEFYLQAGVSYDQIMKFDVSKIPSTATINDVQVILTLDEANSKLTSFSNRGLATAFVTDSAGVKTELFNIISVSTGNKYTFGSYNNHPILTLFQRWLRGETNHGIMIIPGAQNLNMDLFSFCDINNPDPNKRPRVIIKYTPRVTP